MFTDLVTAFLVNFFGERVSSESPNLKSALEQPNITRAKLRKERDAGRIVGPFSTSPFLNFRCSPLGLVPKKYSLEFRMIHHLSYPKGSSVSDFILDYCSTVHYASVGYAIKLLKRLGHGCFMAKTDVKSAFLFIAKSKDKCVGDLQNFVTICNHLGVPLAPENTVGPATVLQFVGIILDSVRQKARPPEEKLQKCRAMLKGFQARRSV